MIGVVIDECLHHIRLLLLGHDYILTLLQLILTGVTILYIVIPHVGFGE